MKKKLPFEDAIEGKLQQAALPDKEQSWQAMEALLDKKKKRRGAFFFRRSPLLLLLLLPGAITWLVLYKQEEKRTAASQKENSSYITTTKMGIEKGSSNEVEKTNEKKNIEAEKNIITGEKIDKGILQNDNSSANSGLPQSFNKNDDTKAIKKTQKTKHHTRAKTIANVASPAPYQPGNDTGGESNTVKMPSPEDKNVNNTAGMAIDNDNIFADSLQGIHNNKNSSLTKNSNNIDSAVKQTTQVNTTADTNTMKKAAVAKTKTSLQQKNNVKKFTWSAGISVQQQIPVGGQKITKYGYNGSINVIDNYIPAVYLRWQKKNKWFIQAEFGYGAPRPVAEFPYSRTTKANNTATEISTTTLKLKKTYYHELPVSFNYYVKKNWSVGAGVTYGILHRAVTEREQAVKNIETQAETRSSNIISAGFTDSFLYKNQYQWLLQTSYEWRKFSFGIRYSRDVLPYIKYTLPAGELNEQKNQTLGFIIRLRLGQ